VRNNLVQDYGDSASKLEGRHPAPAHVNQFLTQDTRLIAPDRSTTAVLLTQRIDPDLHRLAFAFWRQVEGLPSNRATAVGTPSLPKTIGLDGTPSPRHGVAKPVLEVVKKHGTRADTLGYLNRGLSPWTVKRPEMLDANRLLIERVDALYAKYVPEAYAKQLTAVRKAPRWRLWNTVFTSVYIAKNFRTAYHYDSGNLRGVMTAILPTGDFTGGELVLARWRIGIAFKPGDLLFFDPQQLHGNLPIFGTRVSAALYCAGGIA
jgi:hypothetical protein